VRRTDMENILAGKAHTFGDNINTDYIIAGKYTKTLDFTSLAEHVFEDIAPGFSKRVRPGDIVAADATSDADRPGNRPPSPSSTPGSRPSSQNPIPAYFSATQSTRVFHAFSATRTASPRMIRLPSISGRILSNWQKREKGYPSSLCLP